MRFYLTRTDGPGAPINRTITINVPMGASFQIPDPNYNSTSLANDIGLITLPDPAFPVAGQQMVAPYYGAPGGQIGFAPAPSTLRNEVGQTFTMVG